MTKEELENYEPKGQLEGFPKEVIARMLDCQEEQGNKRDVYLFEKCRSVGFVWSETKEKGYFWNEVICNKDFNLFFEKYPKKDNQYSSQEFKVGDEVVDIISGRRGKVTHIDAINKDSSPIFVDFNDDEGLYFTLNGREYYTDKHQRLLHYRDDYDYSVIDFNNLPKKQEPKRWRAEVGEIYYYFSSNFEIDDYCEYNSSIDDEAYDSGNYFQTKEQAQEVADKLKEYFNQLINK